MREFLKVYPAKLKILSPVYIGDGSELTKKEYVLDKRANKFYIYDVLKLFKELNNANLGGSYQDYLINGEGNLATWFYENHIYAKDFMNCVKYELDASDIDLNNRNRTQSVNNKAIKCFYKNAYGDPYIPGSSIKGAVRTALLAGIIEKDRRDYLKYGKEMEQELLDYKGSPKKMLSKEIKKVESAAFHSLGRDPERKGSAVNSIMAGIRVSDSKPFKVDDLVLYQKIDLTSDGKLNRINIMRECIKPGTVIEFEIVVDTTLCKVKIEDILKAVDYFDAVTNQIFYQKFPLKQVKGKHILHLGGGAGFPTKTILYAMFEPGTALRNTAKILDKSFKKHKHWRDVEMGVSPHMRKCTMYKGEIVDMGFGELMIGF